MVLIITPISSCQLPYSKESKLYSKSESGRTDQKQDRVYRLTEEILALIEEMRLKHEAEINLSKQLNIEPEFAKAR
ncbi:hypothetical protein GLOIN_2v1788848 [Rhizophagus irregularis DAOM 181602=DAOM 197198]|uniref:Uncharacterized protein n=1 Tax=Rhizophagus irregularis (strain DAOM 181602 / DAOM 197198 / MUCL 43194) TaxID=747089 RepID=A0A2P4P2Q4_RHIID|nr:hypothetical protein GLOIN_2v1788848 [Rhizophagus irregularis DAOM 181602=DAOM 197198]POG59670.1 hypothetical protein GLOIN_2v1788848 [Rhizophagus irregularis DAOM 181602=DAOM 197198]GBC52589.2 hypothetical protein GLOIN_2v1788848 [Rhizophagus irregularis DAOM 181602=DAOM 197198]|eukprot:XP_025166536.1 hypothetical protein GLOIN_2v1788848 [Rhizophagus irregularis DAOM 181602=DAOM 197198]